MLTPQELLEIVDTLHPQLDTLNQWITADLISRLMARLGRGEEFLLTGTDQWQLEVQEATKRLYDACNFLFDGNFAEAFFGSMHPFSPVNGRFYCENALDAVGKYISRQFDREVAKVNNRVSRYTHGYKTGKHKDGKKK